MHITNIKDLKWSNPEKTAIDCVIEHPKHGWIPFTASVDDTEEHSRIIFEKAIAELLGTIEEYIPPSTDILEDNIRYHRNQLLASSDWTQLPDAREALGLQNSTKWDVYRKALRDITLQKNFPLEVVWPEQP